MSAIFRSPIGLQDYLATKAVGRNPDELLQQVYPTVNMDVWYSLGQSLLTLEKVGTTSAGLNGVEVVGQVPPQEIWMVRAIALVYGYGADGGNCFLEIIGSPEAIGPRYIFGTPGAVGVTLSALHSGISSEYFGTNPFIAYPAEIFRVTQYRVTAASSQADYDVVISYQSVSL